MPKKAPYVFFCQEQSRKDPALRGKPLAELTSLCSGKWNSLGPSERQTYINLSKGLGKNVSSKESKKMDCLGRSLDTVLNEERKCAERSRLHRRDIHSRVAYALEEGVSFHFLEITPWVATMDGKSIPCEIALVSFNLSKGITSRWVSKIHPGRSALGYRGDMKRLSEAGHGLWLDNLEELNADYKGILSKLKSILEPRGKESPSAVGSGLLPVFVASDALEKVETAMEWLVKAAGESPSASNRIVPYEAYILLWDLVSLSPYKSEDARIPTMNMAKAYLERDNFPNIENTSCDFHNLKDNVQCALLRATRLGFILAEFACLTYDLEPIEGCHYPPGGNSRLENISRRNPALSFSFESDSSKSSHSSSISSFDLMKKPPLDPSMSFESAGSSRESHPLRPFLELHKFRDLEELLLKSGHFNPSICQNLTSRRGGGANSSSSSQLLMDDLSESASLCSLNTVQWSLSSLD